MTERPGICDAPGCDRPWHALTSSGPPERRRGELGGSIVRGAVDDAARREGLPGAGVRP